MRTRILGQSLLLALLLAPSVMGREWTDSTGHFTVEAELVAFTEEQVVLKREDGKLVRMELAQLSEADREYLTSKEALAASGRNELQTWTMRGGWKVVGRLVGYGRKQIAIQRRRGKIYVNDRLFDNLPEIYKKMVPQLVAHFENIELADEKAFTDWVLKQKGAPREFTAEGVILELENGDEYTIPFIFFSSNDVEVLRGGWERWLASQEDARRKQMEDFMLQAQARAYQRDREVSRQIATMQLILSAVDAGVTDLWEVLLEPRPGVRASPRFVVVPAINSQGAVQQAVGANPNFVVGAVRRLNRQGRFD